MFCSRCTYEDYLKSIQNEAPAPEDFILDDESDVETTDEVNDEDNTTETYIDPIIVLILEGFNDDEEVFVICIVYAMIFTLVFIPWMILSIYHIPIGIGS